MSQTISPSTLRHFSSLTTTGDESPKVKEAPKRTSSTTRSQDVFEPAPTKGLTFEKRLERVTDEKSAVELIDVVLKQGEDKRQRLQVHHVFDKARAGGYLAATLEQLQKTHPKSKVVSELISQANPKVKPVEITHRGTIGDTFPENTLEGIQDAVKRGATGLEIDLSFTKDGRIVLWHDNDPSQVVSMVRRNGFEGGKFQPTVHEDARKRVDELTLDQVQRHLGYEKKDGEVKQPYRVPTFDDVAAYLKQHPEVKTIALDVKVDGTRAVNQRFARELDRVLTEHGLERDRVFLMTPQKQVVKDLKGVFGDRWPLSHDIDVFALHHEKQSGLRTANEFGNELTSIGRQPIGSNAYDAFVESVKGDRKALDDAEQLGLPKKKLYVWTLDDELELREAIANGVDGIVTNRPFFLQSLLRKYWPNE